MRIAVLSPIFESVPPKGWGGVELVVFNQVEELVRRGHKVTLFSAEGAQTSAKNITNGRVAANHDPSQNADESQRILDQKLLKIQDKFDIIHSHTSHRFLYLEDKLRVPYLLTVHTIFRDQWKPLYRKHPRLPLVSISNSQAKLSNLKLNFVGTVYNGIDLKLFKFSQKRGNYLSWIGRIVRQKGVLEAIEIAETAQIKLKLAGRFIEDSDDDKRHCREVKSALSQSYFAEYVGEVANQEKSKFLKNSSALINPIVWDEPFGLVVPEANACGTPVLAFNRGAMSELIKDGYNGFLIKRDDIKGMVEAVKRIYAMPEEKYRQMRQNCRKHVEKNFTVEKMVDGYERVYQKVIKEFKKN